MNENITTALYWEYDSRIGKRWNVDPVIKEHESPYACFSNNPIWLLDRNGADTIPSSLEAKTYDARSFLFFQTYLDKGLWNITHSHADDINNIYNSTGGDKVFESSSSVIAYMNNNLRAVKENSILLPPTQSEAVTNFNAAFYSASENGSEKAWINLLLGGMVRGTIPENIVFSENGTVSNYLIGSSIYNNILDQWYNAGMPQSGNYNVSYLKEQLQDLNNYGTFVTMSSFIGSCRSSILVNENDNSIKITITNVTSVYSGDYAKHLYWHYDKPPFIRRDPQNQNPQPYSNFSQTYNLNLNLENIKSGLRLANMPVIKPGGWRTPY